MRQKKIKQATKENLEQMGVVITPGIIENQFKEMRLEIGSGKGQFITSLAKDNPQIGFIAMEKDYNVCYRLAEKQQDLGLNNLIVIRGDAANLSEYFKEQSLNIIYLNFSDPWPKDRHHKRRLTYHTFLARYQQVLKEKGKIQFRTDHIDLFNDSLESLNKYFNPIEIDLNLIETNYMTEYEVKKRVLGPIYQYIGELK